MSRVNVYIYPAEDDYESGVTFAGWFDASKAEQWTDADPVTGGGSGGPGRGQAVIRTAQGRWALAHWSRWSGESNRVEYITGEQARDWLLQNGEDEAVARHFGAIPEEEDRRPGRPEVGGLVNVRLGDLLDQVNAYASANGIGTRAGAIRVLLGEGLTASQPYTVTTRDAATGVREIASRHRTLGAAVEALREEQAYDLEMQGLPSTQPRVEHDGRPVNVEDFEPA